MSDAKNFFLIYALILALPLSARGTDPDRARYLLGDIREKTAAVESAAQGGNAELAAEALDFVLQEYHTLGEDEGVISLAIASVRALSDLAGTGEQQAVSALLGKVFYTFHDSALRIAALTSLAAFPSAGNVSIINAYVSEKVQSGAPMDDVLLAAIKSLKTIGNRTSFNLLFVADLLGIWSDYSDALADSYGPLANSCGREILNILSTVSVEQKLVVLTNVVKNPHISEKIQGEVAENALSQAIYTAGDSPEPSESLIGLQLLSLRTIADTHWTRASDMVTEFFSIARNEFDGGSIDAVQFAGVIRDIASVASADMGQVLSQYLDALNKSAETGTMPEEVVILAVINALGGLGDKVAFDYLLYVTYLDYPEKVTQAARNALANLKW
ncbi:MAG: hypothetical protein J1F14_01635 [Treponema sp.]|nr:hypothetical protein [Treponema sp.]